MKNSKHVLRWESDLYKSTEQCVVDYRQQEIAVSSTVTGNYDSIKYTVEYTIRATLEWKTISFKISHTLNSASHQIEAEQKNGEWIVNGKVREEFRNCIDIDITVTPFTNSLPIHRLDLQFNKPEKIEVFYINVLENSIYPVVQQYTKKSDTCYNFQNVPNDFEADIITDTEGFVVHYPELFERY